MDYKKTLFKKILKSFFVLYVFFSCFGTTYALTDYTVLTPLPGTVKEGGTKTDFQTYLPGFFKFAIGVAAVMAFVMITYGGIQYMTSDAIGGVEKGRQKIKDAVYGLILIIGAWAILNTINPKILNFDFTLNKVSIKSVDSEGIAVTGSGILPGYTMNEDQKTENARIKMDLQNGNVYINNEGAACVDGQTKGCTNVVGLPQTAIDGLKQIYKECNNCFVQITGGTEGGHSTHGPGKAVVDLAVTSELSKFLKVDTSTLKNMQTLPDITLSNGQKVSFMYETTGGTHWHVVFK